MALGGVITMDTGLQQEIITDRGLCPTGKGADGSGEGAA